MYNYVYCCRYLEFYNMGNKKTNLLDTILLTYNCHNIM